MRYTFDRRRVLALGIGGAAAGALGTLGVRPGRAGATNAPDLGIAPGNDAGTNRDRLVAALRGSAATVTFPPGDYLLDNSRARNNDRKAIVIERFSGTFEMRAGARLIFTDPIQGGLYFVYPGGGAGPTLTGVTALYATRPTVRTAEATGSITFDRAVSPRVTDLAIDGAPGGGLVFWYCRTPSVERARVDNTMADGVHFANCQDGYANHVSTTKTGDDGVAFVTYGSADPGSGGRAYNVSVTDSRARGISVINQSGVLIDHFGVNWSATAGILVAHESNTGTRVPTDVTFSNGFVYHGGGLDLGREVGNRYGICFAGVGTVAFRHIDVRDSYRRGISGGGGTVRLERIAIERTGSHGANLVDGTYESTDVGGVPGLSVTDAGGIGIVVNNSTLRYGEMAVTNASLNAADGLNRAVSLTGNADVRGTRLTVTDPAPATGYVVGDYGDNHGDLGTIVATVAGRDVTVVNRSGADLTYRLG